MVGLLREKFWPDAFLPPTMMVSIWIPAGTNRATSTSHTLMQVRYAEGGRHCTETDALTGHRFVVHSLPILLTIMLTGYVSAVIIIRDSV